MGEQPFTSVEFRRGSRDVGEPLLLGTCALEVASALDVLGLPGNALVLGASLDRLEHHGIVLVEGTLTPGAVKRGWAQLEAVTEDALLDALRRSPFGRARDAAGRVEVVDFFRELRQAYRVAAQRRLGLAIVTR